LCKKKLDADECSLKYFPKVIEALLHEYKEDEEEELDE